MTDNTLALFKGAGLPVADVAKFKQALVTTQQVAAVSGNTPFLRMLKQDGTWVYGANETEVQEGSHWAINPLSLQIGFVCWNPKGGKPLGKQMRSIFQTPLLKTEMPDLGAQWDENIALELQCLNGEDKGTSVEYTANSYGGRKAFSDLVATLQKQLDADPANIVPIVNLTNDSYKSPQYGLIYNPIFEIVDWMSMTGTAAAPAAEQKTQQEPAPPTQDEAPPKARRGRPPLNGGGEPTATREALAASEQPAPEGGAGAGPVQRRRRRAAATV